MGLALSTASREGLHFVLRQVPLVLVAVVVYFGVRHLTEGDTERRRQRGRLSR